MLWSAYEPGLLRKINACLKPNDILVADAIYGAYVEIALLQHQLVGQRFLPARLPQSRFSPRAKGRKKGRALHLGETQALSPIVIDPSF